MKPSKQAQPLKNPERRHHHTVATTERMSASKQNSCGRGGVLGASEKSKWQVDVFIEPEDSDNRAEPEEFEAKNHLFVSVLFLHFHAGGQLARTDALAMALNQSS